MNTGTQEECHVKMKAESEVTWRKPRNTKDGQKTIRYWERDMGQILPHNPKRNLNDYISSTADHQALDPRGWGPLD